MALQNSWNSSIPIKTAQGGTGYTTFNVGDLLNGNSSGALTTLSVGSNGYALVADSTQATGMKWASVAVAATTFNGNSGSATPSNNALTVTGTTPISITGSGSTLTAALGTVPVSLGGTGVTTMDNGILIGQSGSPIRSLKTYQANVIGGNANGDAQSKTLSSANGSLSFTYTDSNIDIGFSSASQAKVAPWYAQSQLTASPASAGNGNIYFVTATSAINLPLAYNTSSQNPVLKIVGAGSALWTLTVPSGTTVRFGNLTTKSDGTGSIAATNSGDSLEISASSGTTTSWFVTSAQGNLNVT